MGKNWILGRYTNSLGNAKVIHGDLEWVRTKSQVLPMLSLPVPQRKRSPSPLWEKWPDWKGGQHQGWRGQGKQSPLKAPPLYWWHWSSKNECNKASCLLLTFQNRCEWRMAPHSLNLAAMLRGLGNFGDTRHWGSQCWGLMLKVHNVVGSWRWGIATLLFKKIFNIYCLNLLYPPL